MEKEQEEQGFRVTDKRGFNEDGTAVENSEKTEQKQENQSATSSEKPDMADTSSAGEKSSRPSIDFPSYLISYYTQGLVLLGEIPNPYTNKKEEDVEAAQHIIDILSMLEQKTKGNLDGQEEKLLENVLYELRMTFMARTNRIQI